MVIHSCEYIQYTDFCMPTVEDLVGSAFENVTEIIFVLYELSCLFFLAFIYYICYI